MLNSVLNGDWSNSVPGRQFPKVPVSGCYSVTDKILGEIYKWMASSEVCMEKIKMAMNKVMEKGIIPKWWKICRTVMVSKTKKLAR